MEAVFGGLFAEEIDGGGSPNLRLRRHGELFGGGRGPLIGVGDGGQESGGERATEQGVEQCSGERGHSGFSFGLRGAPVVRERVWLLLLEDGAALLVRGDDTRELLDIGVAIRRQRDLADGVGAGVVEGVVVELGRTLVGGEA